MSNQVAAVGTPCVKVAILGSGAIGKSSLTYRFLNKETLENHDATIEDKYKTYERIENENVEIEVLDTAGEEDYQNLRDSWINYAEGFILNIYITEAQSLEPAIRLYTDVIKWQFTMTGSGIDKAVGYVQPGGWYHNQDNILSFRFVSELDNIGRDTISEVTLQFEVYDE